MAGSVKGLGRNHAYGSETYCRSSCLYSVSKEVTDSEQCESQSTCRMEDTNIGFVETGWYLYLDHDDEIPLYSR